MARFIRKSTMTKEDVAVVDQLSNLLEARGYLRKSMRLLEEAEDNTSPSDFELRRRIYAKRNEVMRVWQEVEDDIDNLL